MCSKHIAHRSKIPVSTLHRDSLETLSTSSASNLDSLTSVDRNQNTLRRKMSKSSSLLLIQSDSLLTFDHASSKTGSSERSEQQTANQSASCDTKDETETSTRDDNDYDEVPINSSFKTEYNRSTMPVGKCANRQAYSSKKSTAAVVATTTTNEVATNTDEDVGDKLVPLTPPASLSEQLKEKDLQILELSELIAEKRDFIGRLYFEINEKEDRLVEMANEIKKRKHDMNEMSRRIIEMDQEVKFYQNFDYKQQSVQLSRSCSHIESGKKTIRSTRWKRMIALSKSLIRGPNKSPSTQFKSSQEYVNVLRSILQEKELIITDLRLESKLTLDRLQELEAILRKREEETYLIRKNNDYFEKMIKSKLID